MLTQVGKTMQMAVAIAYKDWAMKIRPRIRGADSGVSRWAATRE